MNPFVFIYTELLWRPLLNGLVWFYGALPIRDLGVAVVLLTVVIRLILAPLLIKTKKAQRDLARIQPEMKKLQERHKGNREAQGKALMELYATHKVNPFSGCLTMLVQFPLLLAIFQVFQSGLDPKSLNYLYSFVSNPGTLEPVAFGVLDLTKGNIYLGVVAAAVQYVQGKLTVLPTAASDKFDIAKMMQWQLPVIILITSVTLPSSLAIYWTVSNIFDIIQEFIITRGFKGGVQALWRAKT